MTSSGRWGPEGFFAVFSVHLWIDIWLPFCRFWHPFRHPFLIISNNFSITFSNTDFALFFLRFWDGFYHQFWCFLTPFPFAHSSSETFVFDDPYCTLARFSLWENIDFHDFPSFFWYRFLHWFSMSFGIDFGSILGAFGQELPYFLAIDVLLICWWSF